MSFGEAYLNAKMLERQMRKQQIATYTAYSRLALLLYEIIINLDREVQLVWSTCGSFQWSNVIYLMNRYPLVAHLIWNVYNTPYMAKVCDTFYKMFFYLCILPTRIAITIVWIQCVYATYYNNLLCWVISILGLAAVGVDIYQGIASSCTHNTLLTETLSGELVYITLTAFDLVATLSVITKLIQTILKSGGFRILGRRSLLKNVFRSGILYFGAVTVPQLVAVVLYFAPPGMYSTIVNNFLLHLSSVMTARFLLGLREAREVQENPECLENDMQLSLFTFDMTTNRSDEVQRRVSSQVLSHGGEQTSG
ncbi:hypothetical protein GYMLUDRAFT_262371 [Collybiopsis luxurians FD-317 M1]|uniref:Unplaced genomic scaffold GYMLUscaffold_35, whole genome shotgun sequence n=1 Tax=Collybiopsis luxurians FD-317 M1 TaxID=944289 RepID=A0A0D0C8L4_9AGAR|nr:hypothetical protein GYMLUDRAFT_262371 [Collybiopsis luxurians FD-317 M1]